MSGWKAKTHEFIANTEGIPSDRRWKDSVDDMKNMIDRIEQTLERLER